MAEWINIGIGIIQLVCAVILAVLALYIGLSTFNRVTRDFPAESELSKGNTAVGIFIASVFAAIALVIESGVQGIVIGAAKASSEGLFTPAGFIDLTFSVFQLVIAVFLAIGSIYLALSLFDRITGFVNMFGEIRNGNVAVAIVVAGMNLGIAVIIHSGVLGITAAFL
jgi:uncharacterized membrane protein YjfL (UPF0719 family)